MNEYIRAQEARLQLAATAVVAFCLGVACALLALVLNALAGWL